MTPRPSSARTRRTFDRDFFDRYYTDPDTAVIGADDVLRRARFVLAYLAHLQLEVRTVLDAGCGTGLWKRALHRVNREIAYTGIDPSAYLATRYGWTRCAIADYRPRRRFDLVVCQDVLQYVDRAEALRSIGRIARACRGALYFDVPTTDDVRARRLDMKKTDRAIHLRSAAWYRRALAPFFVNAGGGVFIRRGAPAVILALETMGEPRPRSRT